MPSPPLSLLFFHGFIEDRVEHSPAGVGCSGVCTADRLDMHTTILEIKSQSSSFLDFPGMFRGHTDE